jgi:sulfite reductase (NADPH) flavoprotein alpha-component
MLRQLHKFPGLLAALLVGVLALSGSVLSVLPVLDRAAVVASPAGQTSIAELAGRVAANYPGVEQIRRTPAGRIVAFYFENDRPLSVVVDPASGQAIADFAPSAFQRWTTNLHRSFFLGDGGRMVAGAGALAMLVLSLSGLQMTARRMGGWRRLAGRARGTGSQRLHVDLGRLAVLGLVLSATTALYLSLTTFALLPDGRSAPPAFPAAVSGGAPLPVGKVAALQAIDLTQLRELSFPYAGDPTDAFSLKTAAGEGFIDQSTGQVLVWQEHGMARQAYEFIYMLHTGQGLWWLGLILGLTALSVPVMGGTGLVVWWNRRRARPRIRGNAPAQAADTVILVGSEGGSTWGFARTLHEALSRAGHKVHTAPMDSLAPSYKAARRLFLLAATYGDGAAPASAKAFLARLETIAPPPGLAVAVLGFGDRQFPKFCQFARDVDAALARRGWASLMPLETIDRQSAQEFSRWGEALSRTLGEELALHHAATNPRSHVLTLLSRSDYGAAVQVPTSILRFALPRRPLLARLTGRAWPRFAAGDLVGILAPDCAVPRFYSLASSSGDGMVEICVRKHPGGVCSGHLHALQPGDTTRAFVKANPAFRPAPGAAPVILIGAGTGVGPLAGFIRANTGARPMHLYFGGRDPASDFLYQDEIERWLGDRRLASLGTAFSRLAGRTYVQDRLRQDAARLRTLIADGAQVMVCGGREMAAGVMAALADVLAPLGLDPATLKARGRYAEDVY